MYELENQRIQALAMVRQLANTARWYIESNSPNPYFRKYGVKELARIRKIEKMAKRAAQALQGQDQL